jgi:hypothetical protein
MSARPVRMRSKTMATWLAALGGSLGLHRFYLHGAADPLGWLLPIPTLLGLYGVLRVRLHGLDDHLSWLLIPLLGLALSAAMLSAIVSGLMPDEKWNARFNQGREAPRSGWLAVIGVLVALTLGATVLMATIAFSAQRYFEYQAEAPPTSGAVAPTSPAGRARP